MTKWWWNFNEYFNPLWDWHVGAHAWTGHTTTHKGKLQKTHGTLPKGRNVVRMTTTYTVYDTLPCSLSRWACNTTETCVDHMVGRARCPGYPHAILTRQMVPYNVSCGCSLRHYLRIATFNVYTVSKASTVAMATRGPLFNYRFSSFMA